MLIVSVFIGACLGNREAVAQFDQGYTGSLSPTTVGCTTPSSNTIYYKQFVQSCGGTSVEISNSTLMSQWNGGALNTGVACVAATSGQLRYSNGSLQLCDGTSWSTVSGGGGGATTTDRISATDNYSMVVANPNPGTVSFTLGNTAGAAYLHPTLGFVGPGVSSTGGISGTTGYFTNRVSIAGSSDALISATSSYSGSYGTLMFLENTPKNMAFRFWRDGPSGVTLQSGIAGMASTANFAIDATDVNIGRGDVQIAGVEGTTAANSIPARLYVVGTGSAPAAVFTTGNVGIGTQSPTSTLQVSGTFTVSSTVTNANPALYVSTSGNVGIGTAAPTDALTINGNNNLTFKTQGQINFNGNSFGAYIWSDGYGIYNYLRQTTKQFGIGISGAVQHLYFIPDDTSTWRFDYRAESGSGVLKFADNGSERMRIDASGNVGIGTKTPSATLSVNGPLSLALNTSAPATCDAAHEGLSAYTGGTTHYMCFCNGTSWVKYTDNTTACTW